MQIIETEKYATALEMPEAPPSNDVVEEPIDPNSDANISPTPKGTEIWWRYGNYCGPGPLRTKTCNKLINGQPLPGAKDIVDQACMDHDLEYCESGLAWKDAYLFNLKSEAVSADKKLIERLKNMAKTDGLNWKQRMAAKTIIGYFSMRHRILTNPPISQGLPSSGI